MFGLYVAMDMILVADTDKGPGRTAHCASSVLGSQPVRKEPALTSSHVQLAPSLPSVGMTWSVRVCVPARVHAPMAVSVCACVAVSVSDHVHEHVCLCAVYRPVGAACLPIDRLAGMMVCK